MHDDAKFMTDQVNRCEVRDRPDEWMHGGRQTRRVDAWRTTDQMSGWENHDKPDEQMRGGRQTRLIT